MISKDGQWHKEYKAYTKTLNEHTLRFIIKDCEEALAANPETPKAQQYRDEICYCQIELYQKDVIRRNTRGAI
jgi:hypothetical protein